MFRYNHALAYNTTSGVPYNTIPLPQDNQDYVSIFAFIYCDIRSKTKTEERTSLFFSLKSGS